LRALGGPGPGRPVAGARGFRGGLVPSGDGRDETRGAGPWGRPPDADLSLRRRGGGPVTQGDSMTVAPPSGREGVGNSIDSPRKKRRVKFGRTIDAMLFDTTTRSAGDARTHWFATVEAVRVRESGMRTFVCIASSSLPSSC